MLTDNCVDGHVSADTYMVRSRMAREAPAFYSPACTAACPTRVIEQGVKPSSTSLQNMPPPSSNCVQVEVPVTVLEISAWRVRRAPMSGWSGAAIWPVGLAQAWLLTFVASLAAVTLPAWPLRRLRRGNNDASRLRLRDADRVSAGALFCRIIPKTLRFRGPSMA